MASTLAAKCSIRKPISAKQPNHRLNNIGQLKYKFLFFCFEEYRSLFFKDGSKDQSTNKVQSS